MRSSYRAIPRRVFPAVASVLMVVGAAGGAAADPPVPDLGPAGTSLIHGDLASTDSTGLPGPGVDGRLIGSSVPGGACSATFVASNGMPLALCTGYAGLTPPEVTVPTVKLFDPVSAAPVASVQLSKGGLLGGVYGYLDGSDRVVVAGGAGAIDKVAHRRDANGRWELFVDERIDIGGSIPDGDAITGVAPDFQGRIWFATTGGVIGTVDSAGSIASTRLPDGEKLTNGLSVRRNGTSVLTTRALYEMRAPDSGAPEVIWRQTYEAGTVRKPGQLGPGSGTTPTYFGPGGAEWVAIVDDAPRPQLIVYRTVDGSQVCRTPAFETSGQGTENSPMAWGNSLVIPSTYGFGYPPAATSGTSDPPNAAFTGGMTRIDVSESGCRRVWETGDRMASLPRLSRADGLIYGLSYGPLPPGGGIQQVGPVYYTAVDFGTGELRAHREVGGAPLDEPLQLTGTIGPDRSYWQATVGRMLRVGP
ncbi:hypothetical protein [Nocardia jinanensis]|uniref:Secreted protein n=1 Tax=Nocardia jinanensis TaxID=382504 RepID=A0A917R5B9_9NOCA|nr:hypothetical protein [Nocardia jinanensis]GGK91116.1 hypothetical protein GCM10011588_01800 [Nocardia jinanensis]